MNVAKRHVLIDRVDQHDHVIGHIRREHALAEPVNFRVAHMLLFDRSGRILLQKIADGKRHAGQWGSSAATYVHSGETYRQAVERASETELGIRLRRLRTMGTTSMRDGRGRKFIGVFAAQLTRNYAITLKPFETAGIEFVDPSEIRARQGTSGRVFTATLRRVLEFYFERTMSV